jgi:hypothetical protein
VGVALHSAWVAAVTVTGPPQRPVFVDRFRIELVGAGLPEQAFHAAAESGLTLAQAEDLLARWAAAAELRARAGLEEAMTRAAAGGHELRSCALVGAPRELPPLASVLRSHPLLHAGEGQLALRAVADAAAGLGLRVLHRDGRAGLDEYQERLGVLGRQAGPPWAADQKKAAAAALEALVNPVVRGGRLKPRHHRRPAKPAAALSRHSEAASVVIDAGSAAGSTSTMSMAATLA